MNPDLLGLAISLALKMDSQNNFTGNYNLDVSPTFAMEAPVGNFGASAMALPGVVLHDPRYSDIRNDRELVSHELRHGEQQRALGPAFWGAYLGTAGRPFEPYDSFGMAMGKTPEQTGMYRDTAFDTQNMWDPAGMPDQFPIFRVGRQDETTRFQFMPGYPGVSFQVGGPSGSN